MKGRYLCKVCFPLIIMIVIGLICPASTTAKKEAVSFRLDWSPGGNHGPYWSALKKGYFAEQGLDVTIHLGKGSGDTIKLVGSGESQFGFASYSVLAQAVNKGLPVKAIFGTYQKNPLGIITFKEQGIRTPKDLVGKSVTMSPYGDALILLPIFLTANNIDPESVKVITMASLAAREAYFLEGKVNGIVEWGFHKIPVLLKHEKADYSFINFSDWGTTLMSNGIVVNTKFLNSKPDVVRRFLVALKKGTNFAMAYPDKAIGFMMEQFPEIKDKQLFINVLRGSFELYRTENNKGMPLGWMSERDWMQTLTTLKNGKKITKILPLDSYYTNRFVPK